MHWRFCTNIAVVKFGTPEQVMEVLITSSPLWEKFTILQLKTNMRLAGLHAMEQQVGTMPAKNLETYHKQKDYKACIDAVALGFDGNVRSSNEVDTEGLPSVICWTANSQKGPIETKLTRTATAGLFG